MQSKSRQEWTLENWATYLGCSVSEVAKYANILTEHFSAVFARDASERWSYALYERPGRKLFQSDRMFPSFSDASVDYNNLLAVSVFEDKLAKKYGVPPTVLQMLLVKTKS